MEGERGSADPTWMGRGQPSDDDAPTEVVPAYRAARGATTRSSPARVRRMLPAGAHIWRLRRGQGPRRRRHRWIVAVVVGALVVSLVVPGLLALANAMNDYTDVRGLGDDGLRHVLAAEHDLAGLSALASVFSAAGAVGSGAGMPASVPYTLLVQRQPGTFYTTQVSIQPSPRMATAGIKPIFYSGTVGRSTVIALRAPGTAASATPAASQPAAPASAGNVPGGTPSLLPDPASIEAAQREFAAAQQDFARLSARLSDLGWAVTSTERLPFIGARLDTVRRLAAIGKDAATLGILLTGAALPLVTRQHGNALSGAAPLLTQSDVTTLQTALSHAQPLVADLEGQLANVHVGDLPLTPSQRALLTKAKAALPKLQPLLAQASQYIAALGWLLGSDAPRHYLVQTLDRAEMRASGGFAGDFGVLTIQQGKTAPFSLTTVERTDYSYGRWYDGWVVGQHPPGAYSWWPIANWGLRDANLSADFPTTAQLVMHVFAQECGAVCQADGTPAQVGGVIEITPVAIAHVLAVTGPLVIPQYGETITAANLESKLHYYQLDPAGIAKQLRLSPNETATSARKAFTGLVAQLLEQRLRSLPLSQLVPVMKQMLVDMRSKDIQVYVSNPTVEKLLGTLSISGAINTAPGLDGFTVVQVNTSASKISACIVLTQTDAVTLDNSGGATHHLTIALQHAVGECDPLPGEFTTYHAYMRIYVPPQARLLSAGGFDTNQPMCKANCAPDPYPGGEMVCPRGGYTPGAETYTLPGHGMGDPPGVLDVLGGPTQTRSDVAGRAMWGGWVAIPSSCTLRITLSWYVPAMVHPSTSSTNAASAARA